MGIVDPSLPPWNGRLSCPNLSPATAYLRSAINSTPNKRRLSMLNQANLILKGLFTFFFVLPCQTPSSNWSRSIFWPLPMIIYTGPTHQVFYSPSSHLIMSEGQLTLFQQVLVFGSMAYDLTISRMVSPCPVVMLGSNSWKTKFVFVRKYPCLHSFPLLGVSIRSHQAQRWPPLYTSCLYSATSHNENVLVLCF